MPTIKTKQNKPFYWRYDADCFADISAQYFSSQFWLDRNAVNGQETGRGTTWFVQHNEHSLVLRHYLRGGLMSKVSKDHYVFTRELNCRSIGEFNILLKLNEDGFPVPIPAAAQVIRKGLHYQADLLTRRIPYASDLLQVLKQPQDKVFYTNLGKLIARFHQHGVFHADLNIQNILQDTSNKFWLIDFDRAQMLKPQARWQKSNLKRLKRSFEKEKIRHGIQWSEKDWIYLSEAYVKHLNAPLRPTNGSN
jgi:3-deoxy-D-manno-octulosonic acid kinase